MNLIIDYGMGNLGSIANMVRKVGHTAETASSAEAIRQAERIILPGVGAFDRAMERINDLGLRVALDEAAQTRRIPILGICLGMQLLARRSEEGEADGLGWLDAEVTRFVMPAGLERLKIPHMGWNETKQAKDSPLLAGLPQDSRFYFVHSYYMRCAREEDVLLTARYGLSFTAAVQHDNIFGVQFHPEKSHRYGMRLLQNFLELTL